jgi:hypothetical protein
MLMKLKIDNDVPPLNSEQTFADLPIGQVFRFVRDQKMAFLEPIIPYDVRMKVSSDSWLQVNAADMLPRTFEGSGFLPHAKVQKLRAVLKVTL